MPVAATVAAAVGEEGSAAVVAVAVVWQQRSSVSSVAESAV